MKRIIEIKNGFYNIVDNNGIFKCSAIPTVLVTMGDAFVAEDDMEISSNGEVYKVSKGDVACVFHCGKDDTEIISFKNEAISNYIKTQLESRDCYIKDFNNKITD